ncbi:hypothetical protein ACJROX_12445 [Pseudalkalibacillus sp. A8]
MKDELDTSSCKTVEELGKKVEGFMDY